MREEEREEKKKILNLVSLFLKIKTIQKKESNTRLIYIYLFINLIKNNNLQISI